MINNRGSAENIRPLQVEKSIVYNCSEHQWHYSHHPNITYFNNMYYAMWSCAIKDEDYIGQQVLMSTSKDTVLWSEPTLLFASQSDNDAYTAVGWYLRPDGLLNAYASIYYVDETGEKETHYGNTVLCRTTADGINWSEYIDLHIPCTPNIAPRRLAGGRLIMCGHVTFPYTDDPYGIDGWKIAGISPVLPDGLVDDPVNGPKYFKMRGEEWYLLEADFFQTPDECIHMLFRNSNPRNIEEKALCLCESTDNGVTYSEPHQIDYSDNESKFNCLRLSDGRYAIISNPEKIGGRCPLSILISNDGENFSTRYDIATEPIPLKFEGRYKTNGVYGYPNAVEANGMLTVIASIQKEDICVFRFAVSDLK